MVRPEKMPGGDSLPLPPETSHPQTAPTTKRKSAESLAPVTAQRAEQPDSKLQEDADKVGNVLAPIGWNYSIHNQSFLQLNRIFGSFGR